MYYRRDINILDGGPDDPTRVWEEYSRIRKHLMQLDQNNISGVRTDRIARADDEGHHGISDIRTSDTDKMEGLGFFPYIDRYSNRDYEYNPDNGTWLPYHNDFYLDLFSRWEATWIVASGCQVEVTHHPPPSATQSRISVEWAIRSSVGTGSIANASTTVGMRTTSTAPQFNSISCIAPIRVPAGPFRVFPMVRPTWRVSQGETMQKARISRANMYAFALYR